MWNAEIGVKGRGWWRAQVVTGVGWGGGESVARDGLEVSWCRPKFIGLCLQITWYPLGPVKDAIRRSIEIGHESHNDNIRVICGIDAPLCNFTAHAHSTPSPVRGEEQCSQCGVAKNSLAIFFNSHTVLQVGWVVVTRCYSGSLCSPPVSLHPVGLNCPQGAKRNHNATHDTCSHPRHAFGDNGTNVNTSTFAPVY